MRKSKFNPVQQAGQILLLAGAFFSRAFCQEVNETHEGLRYIDVKLVDPFGRGAEISSVEDDNGNVMKSFGSYYVVPRAVWRLRVNSPTHATVEYSLPAGEDAMQVILCSIVKEIARVPHLPVLQKISFAGPMNCRTIVIHSVYCGLTKPPQHYTLPANRTVVAQLDSGLYIVQAVEGDKVCRSANIMVASGEEIRIR